MTLLSCSRPKKKGSYAFSNGSRTTYGQSRGLTGPVKFRHQPVGESEQVHWIDVQALRLPDPLLGVAAAPNDGPAAHVAGLDRVQELAQDDTHVPVFQTVAEKQEILALHQAIDVGRNVVALVAAEIVDVVFLGDEIAVVLPIVSVDAAMHLEQDRRGRLSRAGVGQPLIEVLACPGYRLLLPASRAYRQSLIQPIDQDMRMARSQRLFQQVVVIRRD